MLKGNLLQFSQILTTNHYCELFFMKSILTKILNHINKVILIGCVLFSITACEQKSQPITELIKPLTTDWDF